MDYSFTVSLRFDKGPVRPCSLCMCSLGDTSQGFGKDPGAIF